MPDVESSEGVSQPSARAAPLGPLPLGKSFHRRFIEQMQIRFWALALRVLALRVPVRSGLKNRTGKSQKVRNIGEKAGMSRHAL